MVDNIPANAVKIMFSYGKNKGYFYVWPKRDKWQWSAWGNSGEEDTEDRAIAAARLWIKSENKQ